VSQLNNEFLKQYSLTLHDIEKFTIEDVTAFFKKKSSKKIKK
jgi:hypothetical protein